MIGVDHIVIGGVRFIEGREPLSMLLPGEIPAVDDSSAERRAMSTKKLGKGMHNYIGSIFDWPQQDRCRDRIVDDQRNTMLVGDSSQFFDVANIPRRIADAFTKNCACFFMSMFYNQLTLVGCSKSNEKSLAGQNMNEQCKRGSVKLGS